MSEPLDPATAGVATVLRSLRSRAGLRADRLADTGIALDALAGLTTVRQLVATGVSTEDAIVRAVRDATTTLAATDGIVADVILGLGLQPDPLPDPELYASDLGQRRDALRRNWQLLHELRSAWDGQVPSARALRFDVETQALNALATALTAADARVADNEMIVTADPATRARLARSPVPLLSVEFRRIAAELRKRLLTHEDGMGWAQRLQDGSLSPTPVSTSYGLQTMMLIERSLAPDLVPVVDFLRRNAATGGGYVAQAQKAARPEATAPVLDALHQVLGTEPFTSHVTSMNQGLGDFERTRPFILSGVLETNVRLGGDPELIRTISINLLDTRRSFDDLLLWPQKAEEDLVSPVPSVAHTARAVRALALAEAGLPENDELRVRIRDAIEEAGAWLAEGQSLENTAEFLDRHLSGQSVERMHVRHFTASLVVKALVTLGVAATHPAVHEAVLHVWQNYHHETALWYWPDGDLPVWMTFDALEALYLAAFAAPPPVPTRSE
jgi:hypothetical protein